MQLRDMNTWHIFLLNLFTGVNTLKLFIGVWATSGGV
jgi:hypothetical protein